MKILVAGATGGVGREVLRQAVAGGHDVTALAREPAALPASVRGVRADLTCASVADLAEAMQDADAVLSCLGQRSRGDAGVLTNGVRRLAEAMGQVGIRRLVVISAAPVETVASPGRPHPPRRADGDGFLVAVILQPIVKAAFRSSYTDMATMEDYLRANRQSLDWTSVRPPRLLDRPVSGRYRIDLDRNLPGGRAISRADVAHYMLACVPDPATFARSVRIAY